MEETIKRLPLGWNMPKFYDICEIISGKNQRDVVSEKGKYPIYGSGGMIGYASNYLCNENATVIGRKGTINKPIYIKEKFWNVDTAFGLSPYEAVNPKLFYFFCLSYNFKSLDKSTTIPSLAKTDLQQIDFPLPPFAEQERIVAKIEELFSSLDAGVESLKAAREQLKVYRQAVLKQAFEGKLTNENVKDGELPEGWKTVYVADVGEVRLGRQRSPKNISKDSPRKYIRAGNITNEGLNLTDVLEMDFMPKDFAQYKLYRGDILLSEASGSASQVGKAIIWHDEIEDCCFQNTVIRLRPNGVCIPKYLLYSFRYYYLSGLFAKIAGGVGINHLSANKFSTIKLAFPADAIEQQDIVSAIESRLSVCDKLEESIERGLEQAESLRQSILKKAFEGRLVPQDPNDEPASVLLERIQSEKKAAGGTKVKAGGAKRGRKPRA